MTVMTTRTAPVGARFGRPSAGHLAGIDTMVARAARFGAGGRMTTSATDTGPTPLAPAPAAPSPPADTAARLDAQDTQLADHEARIAGLEQRSPPPVVDTEAQRSSPPSSAAAAAPVAAMISGSAIYARMNARPTGVKAAAPPPSAPAMIQTATGSILNARAIHERNNAAAAARAGRASRS